MSAFASDTKKGGGISERARLARNAYLREWRQKNRDKVRRYAESHWERIAARQERERQQDGGTNGA